MTLLSTPVKKWTHRHIHLLRAFGFVSAYSAWIILFKLLVLTFITYFVMSPNSRFQDISEAYSASEVSLVGIAAFLFVALLRWFNPLTSTSTQEIFTPARLEKYFVRGFLHGAVLAFGVSLAFLLSGLFKYLGFFVRFDEVALALANVAFRISGLLLLAYCEEFIFRKKILSHLRNYPVDTELSPWAIDLSAVIITSIFYCGIKILQFDLGVMHLSTLFLISLALGFRTLVEGDFALGAGFWAALLIVYQPLLSLPLLGNEFSGILLIKYQGGSDASQGIIRLITGGAGGPLASFAFQLLLVLDIVRGALKYKKIHLNKETADIE